MIPQTLRLKEIGFESLKKNGNDETRIGPDLKRNARLNELDRIEESIRKIIPMHVTLDASSHSSPDFNKFSYHDCLGGLQLSTSSAEINARIAASTLDNTEVPIFSGMKYDKYALPIPNELPSKTEGIILLPGPNMFSVIDQNRLFEVVDETDWLIKPHPVSNDVSIKELAAAFGYHRVYEPKVSGLALFNAADTIVTTQASEFVILAALSGKRLFDITKRQISWLATYNPQARLFNDDINHNKRVANRVLMHPNSGYLHPDMAIEVIEDRIQRFYNLALELRKPFKMLTSQKLSVVAAEFKGWQGATKTPTAESK